MAHVINQYHLGKALSDVGLVPANCFNVEVLIDARSATVLRYDVFLRDDDLGKLAEAFAAAHAAVVAPPKETT
jgi:hypothetical protein